MAEAVARHATRRSARTLAVAGVVLDLALAVGVGVLRAVNSTGGQRRAEGPLPTIALALVLAAPGIVALVGVVTGRPVLFGAAGIACAPLALVSIAAFPIAVPAGLLLLAFVRGEHAQPSTPLLTGCIIAGFTAMLTVALYTLVTMTAEFSYNAPGGGSESGDYFTRGHAVTSIVIVCVAIVSATGLSRLGPARERAHAA